MPANTYFHDLIVHAAFDLWYKEQPHYWLSCKKGLYSVELLAEAVGAELRMEPVRTLRKLRNNRPQSGISGLAKRRANVLGVYRIENPELVRGKRVLILDDIITTGATAGEAARVLLTAGAKEVHCGCIAVANKRK